MAMIEGLGVRGEHRRGNGVQRKATLGHWNLGRSRVEPRQRLLSLAWVSRESKSQRLAMRPAQHQSTPAALPPHLGSRRPEAHPPWSPQHHWPVQLRQPPARRSREAPCRSSSSCGACRRYSIDACAIYCRSPCPSRCSCCACASASRCWWMRCATYAPAPSSHPSSPDQPAHHRRGWPRSRALAH